VHSFWIRVFPFPLPRMRMRPTFYNVTPLASDRHTRQVGDKFQPGCFTGGVRAMLRDDYRNIFPVSQCHA
jgi:hypothetical protein